jgi:hypothetical protein
MRRTGLAQERFMTNKPFSTCDANEAATELIDRNVSFDFRAFLGKVGPARSRVVLKHEANQRLQAESKQAQNNFRDGQNSRG